MHMTMLEMLYCPEPTDDLVLTLARYHTQRAIYVKVHMGQGQSAVARSQYNDTTRPRYFTYCQKSAVVLQHSPEHVHF